MKIKIFKSELSTDDLESKILEWTNGLNPEIISVNISSNVMHDYYSGQTPTVRNQWNEYICSIVYKVK